MKKAGALLLAVILLTGCSGTSREVERGIALRTKLLNSTACSFDAAITADYGDKLQNFSLQCQADSDGNVQFTVVKPDSIAGIQGQLDGKDGALTFGDTVLCFPLLADEQVTPVSAPWLLMKTLRSGYLTSAMADGDMAVLSINDSYDDSALRLDIWLDTQDNPIRTEILYRQRKILSLDVSNFRIE